MAKAKKLSELDNYQQVATAPPDQRRIVRKKYSDLTADEKDLLLKKAAIQLGLVDPD